MSSDLWSRVGKSFQNASASVKFAIEKLESEKEKDRATSSTTKGNVPDVEIELEIYKNLLDEAHFGQHELSQKLKLLLAEKDAEIIFWKRKSGVEDSALVVNEKDLQVLSLDRIKAHSSCLEESLLSMSGQLKEALRGSNEIKALTLRCEDSTDRYHVLKDEFSRYIAEAEAREREQSRMIETLKGASNNDSTLPTAVPLSLPSPSPILSTTTVSTVDNTKFLDQQLDELLQAKQAMENDHLSLQTKYTTSQNEVIELQNELNQLQRECIEEGMKMTKVTADMAKVTDEFDLLKEHLNEVEQQLRSKNEALIVLTKQHTAMVDVKRIDDAEILRLKEQLQSKDEELELLGKEKHNLTEHSSESSERMHALTERIHELNRQVHEFQEQLRISNDTHSRLSQQLVDATEAQNTAQQTTTTQQAERQQLEELHVAAMATERQRLNDLHAAALVAECQRLNHLHADAMTAAMTTADMDRDHAVTRATSELQTSMTTAHQEALTMLDMTHKEAMSELQSMLDKMMLSQASVEASHQEAIAKVEMMQGVIDELQSRIATMKTSHQEAIATLETTHKETISTLEATHQEKISALQSTHQQEISTLQTSHQETMDALETSHQTKIAALENAQKDVMSTLESTHQKSVTALEKSHQEAITTLETRHNESINVLETDHREAISKLEAAQQATVKTLESTHESVLQQKERQHTNEIEKLQQQHAMALTQAVAQREDALAALEHDLSAEFELAMAESQTAAEEILHATERIRDQALADLTIAQTNTQTKVNEALVAQEHTLMAARNVALLGLRTELQGTIDAANRERDEYKERYNREYKRRKDTHNKLLELQGNIRVICRVRPILDMERNKGGEGQAVDVTEILSEEDISIQKDYQTKTTYEYDRVFAPSASQSTVFEAVQPLCLSVLDGYNVCIFAYGQTGSGKTFTIEGSKQDYGVSPRAVSELFRIVNEEMQDWSYTFHLSMLEIYNETIRDLLDLNNNTNNNNNNNNSNPNTSSSMNNTRTLDVRQTNDGNVVIPGLTEVIVTQMDQVLALMTRGHGNRAVGSHDMNEHSSRSHSITTLTCRGKNNINQMNTYGKLHLIDLAGSERLTKTDATGDRLKESQNINKSLSALGDVINALGNKKATHIPYRNSKLTYLLQDSLGGNSKVMMIVNVAPVRYNVNETVCSLNFATRCRNVELGQAKRQVFSGTSNNGPSIGSGGGVGYGMGSEVDTGVSTGSVSANGSFRGLNGGPLVSRSGSMTGGGSFIATGGGVSSPGGSFIASGGTAVGPTHISSSSSSSPSTSSKAFYPPSSSTSSSSSSAALAAASAAIAAAASVVSPTNTNNSYSSQYPSAIMSNVSNIPMPSPPPPPMPPPQKKTTQVLQGSSNPNLNMTLPATDRSLEERYSDV